MTIEPEVVTCAPTDPVAVRPSALVELLRHIPNEPDYRQAIRFNDIGLFNRDAGLSLPSPDCDDQLVAYAETVWEGMGLFHGPSGVAETPSAGTQSQLTAWGFSFLEYSAVVETGAPSNPLRLRLADVNRQRVAKAVASDDEWIDDLVVVDDFFFDWGRSLELDRRSGARPFGAGGALALGDGIVIQSDDAAIVSASRRANEEGTGIDNDPHFSAVATELDRLGVHAAYLTEEVAIPENFEVRDRDDVQAIPRLVAAFPALPKPGAVGLGWTDAPDGGRFTVVMSAASSQEAQSMVDSILLRVAWEIPEINYSFVDRFTVIEAAAVGDTAVVVLGSEERVWLDRMVFGLFLAPTS